MAKPEDERAEAFLRQVEEAAKDLDVERLKQLFAAGADLAWEVREEAALAFADVPGTEPKDPETVAWINKQIDRAAAQGGDAWPKIRDAFETHARLDGGNVRLWAFGAMGKRRQEELRREPEAR